MTHEDILKSSVERFFRQNGRWPTSMHELDPYEIRGFGAYSVLGFQEATDNELRLRYVHRTGKAVVQILREVPD